MEITIGRTITAMYVTLAVTSKVSRNTSDRRENSPPDMSIARNSRDIPDSTARRLGQVDEQCKL